MSMKKFKRAFIAWCYGLLGGCIGAGASAIGSAAGLAVSNAAGVDVPQLNLKAMGVVFLVGVVTHAVIYMKQSPLPPLEFDDTTVFEKSQNEIKTAVSTIPPAP